MKVLHICNDYSYSKVYKNLYWELDKKGEEQIIYHPLRNISNKGNNIFDFENQDSKLIYSSFLLQKYHRLFFRLKIKSLFKDLKKHIDPGTINISYATTLFSDGAIAYKLKKLYGIPYVVAVRNTDVNFFLKYRPDLIALMHKILESSDRIIFISEGLKKLFYGHPKIKIKNNYLSKTEVISNGIEDIWLDNIGQYRSENKNLLFVGRFDTNKNIENVIKALAYLKPNYPDLKLNLVGGGGDKNELILKLIEQHKDWINYLGYIYEKNELLEVYRKNNYFVMPSIFETFGLVYIEALSQGLPILYTKNQGVDGIFDEKVGIATTPDFESIRNNLKCLLDRTDYDLNSIDFNKYKWSNIADRYINIFKEII